MMYSRSFHALLSCLSMFLLIGDLRAFYVPTATRPAARFSTPWLASSARGQLNCSNMSLKTPPDEKVSKIDGREEENSSVPRDIKSSGLNGSSRLDVQAKTRRALGVAEPEEDLMWRVNVNADDMMAFLDRSIDTAEDAVMHLGRVFKKPMEMNLPLRPGEEDETPSVTRKERVVILGTGWGGHAISKVIDVDKFEVIYVSPRNYFIFTPLLAAASVGTVDLRSITEPIRLANPCIKYVAGEAVDIKPAERKIIVALPSPREKRPQRDVNTPSFGADASTSKWGTTMYQEPVTPASINENLQGEQQLAAGDSDSDDIKPLMELTYDKLVYAVGTKTGTFGVPGVLEYCYMLKEAWDARLLRAAIVNRLDEACLPGVTAEEKRKLLSFVVIGAGPTGVEFTGELTDLIANDVPRLFPELVGYVSVTVVSAGNMVLPMFDEVLQDRGLRQLLDQGIEILLSEVASQVTKDEVLLKSGIRVPYGLCFWAGGTEARPLTRKLIEALGPVQREGQGSRRGQITVDPYLRAHGSNGTILALGDASSVEGLSFPTTGQVAAQEGAYVARLLNRGYNTSVEAAPRMTGYSDDLSGLVSMGGDYIKLRGRLEASRFHFINLGVLAYIGTGQAVAQVRGGDNTTLLDAAGSAGFFLWRSTYYVKQVSPRNRINVAVDWLKVRVFGRDITRL